MDHRFNRNLSNGLPAGVYIAMAGLGALFALGAWGFADADYTNLVLVVVSGLIAIAIAIPLILYLATRSKEPTDQPISLRDWIAGDFEAAQDRVKSSRALVEILLPI
ncbi:MAG TPA: hypothetical protein VJQ55_12215, partial [Candidatus Binatia bacterium]|nr:hypothetical protein [Candidatus Binatia bacterium]